MAGIKRCKKSRWHRICRDAAQNQKVKWVKKGNSKMVRPNMGPIGMLDRLGGQADAMGACNGSHCMGFCPENARVAWVLAANDGPRTLRRQILQWPKVLKDNNTGCRWQKDVRM
ncbi:hypothetical protein BCR44DRAFT_46775 [Catenaria anguillulae PL171]|uniref:Uncharacterized protein n=1 Tax=Catenaria anguillulae PL171 TaxID=765915 RepID=A0A1Y2H0I3_9FUNG|nr:hypothetical protein BCR44DRAFT_46775 [Catenaria anguillulae PL171]